MKAPWHTTKIIGIEDATPTTKRFFFQFSGLASFDFKPGQFVTMDLPVGEKPKDRWRSYSIASHPDGSNVIELVIVFMEGGKGTRYLFNDCKVGTEIRMMGPLGKFILPDKPRRELCFVCTGTGIAPFRSMLWHIYMNEIPFPKTYLIFGTRTIGDILYYEEMNRLAGDMEHFEYLVTLSREQTQDWKGGKGYVHALYEELFKDHRPADFYLCGWRNMIDEARKRLAAMGYKKEHIHFEIYG